MEIYQWLLRQNGFKVSDTGYFVYCNGQTDRAAFDAKLEFAIKLIPYTGDANWVPEALIKARACLSADKIPAPGADCDYCRYAAAREKLEAVPGKPATLKNPASKGKPAVPKKSSAPKGRVTQKRLL
jgi:hypothetical protein